MPGITRLPFKPNAVAIYNPSENTTFSAMTPQQSTTYTVAVTRNFRPYRNTNVYFPSGLPVGLLISAVTITGAALTGWTASYTLFNGTSSTITPASQTVILWQND